MRTGNSSPRKEEVPGNCALPTGRWEQELSFELNICGSQVTSKQVGTGGRVPVREGNLNPISNKKGVFTPLKLSFLFIGSRFPSLTWRHTQDIQRMGGGKKQDNFLMK